MLHAVSLEDSNLTIVHANGQSHDQRTLWRFEAFPQIGIQIHDLRRLVKLSDGEPIRGVIEFRDHGNDRLSGCVKFNVPSRVP